MSLQAYTRIDSGVAVIELDGEVRLGEGSGLLRDSIRKALDQGFRSILLDLEGVSYIDSAGLGELVGCNARARREGAQIKLANLQNKIQGLMQITKLSTIFETFENENDAVKSFGS